MSVNRIGSNAKTFSVVQTDKGTNPTAQGVNEILTLTSSDGSVCITGDLATDTVDFTVVAASGINSNKNVFGSVSALASGLTTTVTTYTVPIGMTFNLQMIEFDGTNMARYQVLFSAVVNATKNTYFGGQFFGNFPFDDLLLAAGTVVRLEVLHGRSETGDFSGRILGTEN